MNLRATLLASALVSLPVAAQAQTAPERATPTSLPTAVTLTRGGVHADMAGALADGLEVIDTQRVDVDGDGDQDVLAFIDIAESADEDKPDLGRGVAVFFHERHGWRGETIASVGRFPVESGFNWGEVEQLRAGATPLLHVLFSEARPGGETSQADTVVRFDGGALRPVFASVIGRRAQRVSVRAADVDGDGTSELLEQVATEAHCFRAVRVPASEARRVLRWDSAQGRFVDTACGPVASRRTQRGRPDTVAVATTSREH
jgi:hypothetical protein